MINYIYEAIAGDNLVKIAEILGVTENQIRKWNNLKEEDVHIYVGKKFTIWMPNDSSNVSLTHFGERQIRHNAMMKKPDLFYFKDEFKLDPFFAGGLAGLVNWTGTYPIDV